MLVLPVDSRDGSLVQYQVVLEALLCPEKVLVSPFLYERVRLTLFQLESLFHLEDLFHRQLIRVTLFHLETLFRPEVPLWRLQIPVFRLATLFRLEVVVLEIPISESLPVAKPGFL